jgi:hypothetical protein
VLDDVRIRQQRAVVPGRAACRRAINDDDHRQREDTLINALFQSENLRYPIDQAFG